jgi:esterase/lipase superfamily enzyme
MEENILTAQLDKEMEAKVWKEIAKIDGAAQYFKTTMNLDMRRFFATPKENQDMIKGHYAFANYCYDLIIKNSD